MNWSAAVKAHPVDLQRSLAAVNTFALTKIDTEGSEIETLLALDWSKLETLIVEFQADAWKYNNISRTQGTDVVRRLIKHRSYEIQTLFTEQNQVWKSTRLIAFLKRQKHTFREFLFVRQK